MGKKKKNQKEKKREPPLEKKIKKKKKQVREGGWDFRDMVLRSRPPWCY
jgi:hypothetical protein